MSIDMMTHGLMPLGIIPVSFIAEHAGIDVGLFCSAIALIVATLLCGIYLPALRHIDKGFKNERDMDALTQSGQTAGYNQIPD